MASGTDDPLTQISSSGNRQRVFLDPEPSASVAVPGAPASPLRSIRLQIASWGSGHRPVPHSSGGSTEFEGPCEILRD